MRNKHLVLVGTGHTHLHLLKNAFILQKHKFTVTLISPTDFYYNGLAPGVLSKHYPKNIGHLSVQCHLDTINGHFIKEKVVGIDIEEKTLTLSNDENISYDIVSFNIGAKGKNPLKEPNPSLFPTRPVSKLWSFQNKLISLIEQCPETLRIAIIGGGAAGVELAGNIHHFIRANNVQSGVVLITRGSRLLPQFSSSAGSKVSKTYQKRGIQILLSSEVSTIHDQTIVLANQEEIPFDLCISATGVVPNVIESQKALKTTSHGELIVNKNLQCKDHSNIFAAGDCICFESHPLWKSGYHAINQGPVLLHNVLAVANNSSLRPYKPKSYIYTALNLGDGTGIAIVGRFTYHGKITFKIKDYIERRFLRTHQC